MKVIFLEDVPNVAEAGEAKEVADGYGRNFLIPRKLAVLANSAASNIVEAQLKMRARRQAQTEAEMVELANQLEGKEVILKARTGAKDRLYGSITSADIEPKIKLTVVEAEEKESWGSCNARPSGARLSCDTASTGTLSSRASPLREREISLTS